MSITQPQALKQLLEHNEQEAMRRRAAERDKQREIERLSDKAFWEATARHWHDRAAFLETTVKGLRDGYSAAVQEMEAQNIERAEWRKDAEQHRTDCIKAEQRSDALGEILDALKQGYQIEPFPGRATWWTMDTDTLAQIAKDARDWQLGESEKPPVYMGKGEGEPFTMGGQEFKPEDEPNQFIPVQNGQKPGLADHCKVEVNYLNGYREILPVSAVNWRYVKHYRIAQPEPQSVAIDPSTVEDGEIPFIVWEWGYRPATLNPYDVVEAKLANGLVAAGIAANIVWDAEEESAVTAYRVLKFAATEQQEPTKAEVEAEELIGLANHIHSSMNGLPEEWEPWATEIRERIRQVAHRLNQK